MEEPQLKRMLSAEAKSDDVERFRFIEVDQRMHQIALQISDAMRDPNFDIQIDFNRLMDFCLDGAATFIYGLNKDIANEKVFISHALDIWASCKIQTGGDLAWERKPEQMEEDSQVHNMKEFII